MVLYILNESGEPARTTSPAVWSFWAQSFAGLRQSILADDTLPGGVNIRTMFVGYDDSSMACVRPRLWHTMIAGGPHGGKLWRSESKREALSCHAHAVECSKAGAA